ncbi:MAG: leucyl aminopeptidase [Robiginitomaculum sp.]|nr:leucyl aminopeptidase [Robiginitomaculum sp.]
MRAVISKVGFGFILSCLLAYSAYAQTNSTQFEFADVATNAEHIAIFVGKDGKLSKAVSDINAATEGRLETALKDAEFKGKFGKKLHLYGLSPFKSIVVVGTGEDELLVRQLRDLGGYVAQANSNNNSISVIGEGLNTTVEQSAAQLAFGYALGSYSFDKYKTKTDDDNKDKAHTISFHSDQSEATKTLFENDLSHLATGVSFARDMGTEPGKSIYPENYAQGVRKLFKGIDNVKVEIMGVGQMKRKNMGALLGVGQGSIHDPRLVIVTYMGGASDEAPIALVGKGITFDTGGISLKPNTGQWAMKSDLSGAAAVAGTLYAVAKRGDKVNLVGVMAMAENMPSGDAIRPGDVLTTMSGKTIEVISTDAEGRLVLSDAVTYAQEEYDPRLLINIATLTGAAARAMGEDYAAVITRDWDLAQEMMRIGKAAGEDVWPLPLNKNHYKAIRSDIADIKGSGGNPGASIGAAVIGTFIDEDRVWVHLDIAGVDWLNKARPTTPKGHAGWGVRFLDAVVRENQQAE